MKNIGLLVVVCFLGFQLMGQEVIRGPIAYPSPDVNDGFYFKEVVPTKKVIPYEYVREADVMWSKRIWRAIDLREKFNHPLYYPLDDFQDDMDPTDFSSWRRNTSRWSLWSIIRYHVLVGDLTLYSPFDPDWQKWKDGDLFKYPFTQIKYGDQTISGGTFMTDKIYRKEILDMQYLGYELIDSNPEPYTNVNGYDSTVTINGVTETVYPDPEFVWYKSEDIVQYRIKEDWFFDKERSVMDVRIIGICPVIYDVDPHTGNILGMKELFWLYFPECRYVFQNFYVQSRHNDSQRMSFDDLFWKRMFQSYIIKESNIYDRDVQEYKAGVDALLESEKIKEKIFNFEHDLWSY